MVRRFKELTDQYDIGTVEHLSVHMASVTGELLSNRGAYAGSAEDTAPEPATWTDPSLSGGGYAQAQLSHALGLALWLTRLRAAEAFAFTASPLGAPVELHDAIALSVRQRCHRRHRRRFLPHRNRRQQAPTRGAGHRLGRPDTHRCRAGVRLALASRSGHTPAGRARRWPVRLRRTGPHVDRPGVRAGGAGLLAGRAGCPYRRDPRRRVPQRGQRAARGGGSGLTTRESRIPRSAMPMFYGTWPTSARPLAMAPASCG